MCSPIGPFASLMLSSLFSFTALYCSDLIFITITFFLFIYLYLSLFASLLPHPHPHPHPILNPLYHFIAVLQLDYEWYLGNQILPPISRLCEPIEGTSAAEMSARLGLDASK